MRHVCCPLTLTWFWTRSRELIAYLTPPKPAHDPDEEGLAYTKALRDDGGIRLTERHCEWFGAIEDEHSRSGTGVIRHLYRSGSRGNSLGQGLVDCKEHGVGGALAYRGREDGKTDDGSGHSQAISEVPVSMAAGSWELDLRTFVFPM